MKVNTWGACLLISVHILSSHACSESQVVSIAPDSWGNFAPYEPRCLTSPDSDVDNFEPDRLSEIRYGGECYTPFEDVVVNSAQFLENLGDRCAKIFIDYKPYTKIVLRSAVVPPPAFLHVVGAQFLAKFQEEAAKCAFFALVDTLDIVPEAKGLIRAGYETVSEGSEAVQNIGSAYSATSKMFADPLSNRKTRELTVKLEKAFTKGVEAVEHSKSLLDIAKPAAMALIGTPWVGVQTGIETAEDQLEECNAEAADSSLVAAQSSGFEALEKINNEIYLTQSKMACIKDIINPQDLHDKNRRLLQNRQRERKLLYDRFSNTRNYLSESYRACKRTARVARRIAATKRTYREMLDEVDGIIAAEDCNNADIEPMLRSLSEIEQGNCGRHVPKSVTRLRGRLESCNAPDGLVPLTATVGDVVSDAEELSVIEEAEVSELAPVTVTVVDRESRPIKGAVVMIGEKKEITLGDGAIQVMMNPGQISIVAQKSPAYQSVGQVIKVDKGAAAAVTVTLPYAPTSLLALAFGPDGKSLQGVSFGVKGYEDLEAFASSDGEGRASFMVTPGVYTVRGVLAGYTSSAKNISVEPGSGGSGVFSFRYTDMPVSVKVFDKESNQPVSNVSVSVIQDGQSLNRSTNDSGMTSFDLYPGSVTVTASNGATGASATVVIPPGNGFGPIALALEQKQFGPAREPEREREPEPRRGRGSNPLDSIIRANSSRGQQVRQNEREYDRTYRDGYREEYDQWSDREARNVARTQNNGYSSSGSGASGGGLLGGLANALQIAAERQQERQQVRQPTRSTNRGGSDPIARALRNNNRDRQRAEQATRGGSSAWHTRNVNRNNRNNRRNANRSRNSRSNGRNVNSNQGNRSNNSSSSDERQRYLRAIQQKEKDIKDRQKWIKCLEEGIRRYLTVWKDCNGRWMSSDRQKLIREHQADIKQFQKDISNYRRTLNSLR